jgi:hypothetical protein
MNSEAEMYRRWVDVANKILLGRKIVKIRWQTETEAHDLMGWHSRSVELHLDDGTIICPQRDDEGNDAGALLWINPKETVESEHFPGEKFTKTEVLPVF